MTKEELIKLGLSEELADKVASLHKSELDGKYIPKQRFDEVNNTKKALEETVKERDKQLDDLKKSDADVDVLKKQIADLQAANKKAADEHKAEMIRLKIDGIVDSALLSAGAKNTKAIRALMDVDGFKLQEDGTVFGLKEALSAVRKSDPYLFESKETKPEPQGMKGFEPQGGGSSKPDINTMSYSEYMKATAGTE